MQVEMMENNRYIMLIAVAFLIYIVSNTKSRKNTGISNNRDLVNHLNMLIEQYNLAVSRAEIIFERVKETGIRNKDYETLKNLDTSTQKFMKASSRCSSIIEQMKDCGPKGFRTLEPDATDELNEMLELLKLAENLERNSVDFNLKSGWQEEEAQTVVDARTDYFIGCNDRDSLEKRYKALAKAYHPDNQYGDAEIFRKLQREYEIRKSELR